MIPPVRRVRCDSHRCSNLAQQPCSATASATVPPMSASKLRAPSSLPFVVIAAALFTACSQNAGVTGPTPAPVDQGYRTSHPSGPNGLWSRQPGTARGWITPKKSKGQLLYVADSGNGLIDIYSVPDYSLIGQITDAINWPEGIATDKKGNLYVSNLFGNTVTVYPEGQITPSLTLSEPEGPDDVAIADNGYVLVGDVDGGVDVYKPGGTSASSRLTNPNISDVSGVGVDANNNLYAVGTYHYGTNQPQPAVVKYAALGGSGKSRALSGLLAPGGVLVDKHRNIVISDFALPGINMYKPGKEKPFATIANSASPDRSAINRKQDLIYVPEGEYDEVSIYTYPSGELVQNIVVTGYGFTSGAALSPPAKP